MLTLGLLNMRDAAAALVHDGRVLAAAEEERFARVKHVTALPAQAIRACLAQAGVKPAELDAVAVPWKYWQVGRRAALALGAMLRSSALCRVKAQRSAERLSREWKELACLSSHLGRVLEAPVPLPVFLDHHLCHAASSFLVSPFERAAVLVVDGASESHTTLLAVGEGSTLRIIKRVPLPHSLGQFYAAVTAYLGFIPDHDEYIVMGLAAYGEPRYADLFRTRILSLLPQGGFRLNTALLDFHLARVGIFLPEFVRVLGPNRPPGDDITQRHRDIAASAQAVLEETLLHLARHLRRCSGLPDLCLAGGVAFNCVANSRLQRDAGFERVYVPPAAGDAGAALGAALWRTALCGRLTERTVMRDAYLGPSFEERACERAAAKAGLVCRRLPDQGLCDFVAEELARGRLVFWFQGRMEWGPRALGSRSLLADPRREDMRELINAKVKLRQPFRPFAPSVLEERASDYFDLTSPSPFMLFTPRAKATAKGVIPAVIHVDGTARVQTVDRDANPMYRRLLESFARITGVPVLLNTSFNVNEPIVCSPDEAVACFLKTQVEWLVMGNLLISRPDKREG
jgi:carbamoyltransferase